MNRSCNVNYNLKQMPTKPPRMFYITVKSESLVLKKPLVASSALDDCAGIIIQLKRHGNVCRSSESSTFIRKAEMKQAKNCFDAASTISTDI
ncbi:hypothetical protein GUITHDRAFT_103990 [Guillardia theta CCMP2712]|uniref:Uncharacterized protein n=1 Tax=Guillardia theta (strain CCMP2712) TaxID=905079 RepID=L1JPH6_GUITC|nr:hypothetical protein GUITHDRAFT_103990 [Guillardia theta CCMP2712]EKX50179.1 hypothetical protein GUITHDRAFT_103990 [Guillardia theta CCMP2712]|eukprot:XP_005837159.1 hypothetical protein GUITHDRAFT_103990 [Guillardia theta CCMP2712]